MIVSRWVLPSNTRLSGNGKTGMSSPTKAIVLIACKPNSAPGSEQDDRRWVDGGLSRCQPWRAKRRLVDPSSREAALFSRHALRQRENKVGLRTRRPVIWEPSTAQQLSKLVVAQCLVTRTAGAPIGCQRPSRFWGLGCPKIYHEAEETLVLRMVA